MIHKTNFNKKYWVALTDYDSSTDNDNLGFVGFTINEHKGENSIVLSEGEITVKLKLEWIE